MERGWAYSVQELYESLFILTDVWKEREKSRISGSDMDNLYDGSKKVIECGMKNKTIGWCL